MFMVFRSFPLIQSFVVWRLVFQTFHEENTTKKCKGTQVRESEHHENNVLKAIKKFANRFLLTDTYILIHNQRRQNIA